MCDGGTTIYAPNIALGLFKQDSYDCKVKSLDTYTRHAKS